MKKMIVYCHGYASSAQTDKVNRLAQAGDAYAWDIDIDPKVSLDNLSNKIDDVLTERINEDVKLIFVGTSLGAWYASKLAQLYGGYAILINPAINPKDSLARYGVPDDILNNYETPIQFQPKDKVFIGKQDEVFDYSATNFSKANVEYVDAQHRFNGPEFDRVVEYVQSL